MQKEITNLLELPNDYEYITNDIIKKFYTKNINKIIEDNTNIFSVFHYNSISLLTQKDGVLTIDLVKSRDSVNGKKLSYNVDFDKGTFNYIPSENDALSNTMSDEEKEKTFTSLKDEFEYADEEDSTIF